MNWVKRKLVELRLKLQYSDWEKAVIAYELYFEKTKENSRLRKEGRVTKILADKVGLSQRTFQRAKAIIERGSKTLHDELKTGKKSIGKARKEI